MQPAARSVHKSGADGVCELTLIYSKVIMVTLKDVLQKRVQLSRTKVKFSMLCDPPSNGAGQLPS